ncbi:hypothetical protein MP638_001917 [Amoeboaphelidium occidentale]|nr:hypothetical protein MP638_001917 [Amoeboaphelidium occidentale]
MDQMQQVIASIEAIEQVMVEARNEVKECKEQLKRAVGDSEITRAAALLDSATAELSGLRKEKDLLMKEKAKLTSGLNQHEGSSRIHSDLTETFENMARINIQKHLYRLFHVGYQEEIGYLKKGAGLSDSAALGIVKTLYPDFKRNCSKEIDALLYLEKPAAGWCVHGNQTEEFVSIGHESDFTTAVNSLNCTDPLDQLTPPPSLEELNQDSKLEYKKEASFLAVFEAATRLKWYSDKAEQLELQLAYLGLKVLIREDATILGTSAEIKRTKLVDIVPRLATTRLKWYSDKAEQLELQLAYLGLKVLIRDDATILGASAEIKRTKLVDIVPRLVAFAGFSSCDSYENIKDPLIDTIKQDKFPLLSILFERGRLIYCYKESIGGELMQLRHTVMETAQNYIQVQATLKELEQKMDKVFETVVRNKNP